MGIKALWYIIKTAGVCDHAIKWTDSLLLQRQCFLLNFPIITCKRKKRAGEYKVCFIHTVGRLFLMTQQCFVDRCAYQQLPLKGSCNSGAHDLTAAVSVHLAHQWLLWMNVLDLDHLMETSEEKKITNDCSNLTASCKIQWTKNKRRPQSLVDPPRHTLQSSCRLDNNQAKRHLSCGPPRCYHTGTQRLLTGFQKLRMKVRLHVLR